MTISDLDSPGWHSGQGSIIPGISKEIWSRQKISGHSDRIPAQNFDAVLAVIVIWAHGPYLKILSGGAETHSKTPISQGQSQGQKDIHSYERGSWNHTRQYTFLSHRILKSYQAICFLITQDPESQAYTFWWQRIPKSYQAIYFLKIQDTEIIQDNILFDKKW